MTDDELARARRDPGYRQLLLTESLDQLMDELNRRKQERAAAVPSVRSQLREGAELAVRLADLITRINKKPRG